MFFLMNFFYLKKEEIKSKKKKNMNSKDTDYIPYVSEPVIFRDPNSLPLLPETWVKPIQKTLTQWQARQEMLTFSKMSDYGFTVEHGSRDEITSLTVSRLYRNGSIPILPATVLS